MTACIAGGVTSRPVGLALAATLALGVGVVAPSARAADEDKVKAAFIFNFVKFIEWPPGRFEAAGSPVIIGVLHGDSAELERSVAGKTAGGRPVEVRKCEAVEAAGECHLVVLGSKVDHELAAVLEQLHKLGTVTVGDQEGFAAKGGILGLVRQGSRYTFEVNLASAKRAGVKLDSKLLKLGKIVGDE